MAAPCRMNRLAQAPDQDKGRGFYPARRFERARDEPNPSVLSDGLPLWRPLPILAGARQQDPGLRVCYSLQAIKTALGN